MAVRRGFARRLRDLADQLCVSGAMGPRPCRSAPSGSGYGPALAHTLDDGACFAPVPTEAARDAIPRIPADWRRFRK